MGGVTTREAGGIRTGAPTRGRDAAGPRGLVALYRRLSGLVAAPSADVQAVAAVMAGELGVLAAVVGPQREVLAAAAPGMGVAEASALVRADARTAAWPRALEVAAAAGRALRVPGPWLRGQVVAPVLLGREVPAFVFAEEIITLIYTRTYLEGAPVLRLYVVALVAFVVELVSVLFVLKQGGFAARVNAMVLAIALPLSWYGATHWGLIGAAAGSVAAIYAERLVSLGRIARLTGTPVAKLQDWHGLAYLVAGLVLLFAARREFLPVKMQVYPATA